MKQQIQYILKSLSVRILKKYNPKVIGITGSYGKTSAKNAVFAVLNQRYRVRASQGNYNNELGVPLTIIGVESPGRSVIGWLIVFFKAFALLLKTDNEYPGVLILEMGADHPGDIGYLTSIAPCDIGILTAIGSDHLEFFKTQEKLAREKRIIISHLKKDGYAIVNHDDELVMAQTKHTKATVITYGLSEESDVQLIEPAINGQGIDTKGLGFKLKYQGSVVPLFIDGVVGYNTLYAALAAAAVGVSMNMNLVDVAHGLETYKGPRGRMVLIKGIKNTLLIDDTYKGAPEATISAIDTLKSIEVSSGARRIAVLGDMLELGERSDEAHKEVGQHVAHAGVDELITVGSLGVKMAYAAQEAGMPEHSIFSFDNSVEAGRFLQDRMKQYDIVLVKGSQGARMEKIIKEVMARPLHAPELLVRQGKGWV